MKAQKKLNIQHKPGVAGGTVSRVRKKTLNLADFFGEGPGNEELRGQIRRALVNINDKRKGNLTENDAFALGVLAFIYSYSIVEVERTLYDCTNLSGEGRTARFGGWNTLKVLDTLHSLDPGGACCPDDNTLYCGAALDLGSEPVLLYTPDIGERYFIYQFIDAHANSYAYIGTRATHGREGVYAIVGPGWRGKLPKNLHWIQSMTPHNLMLGRVFVAGADEVPGVREIYARSTLAPLSRFEKENGNELEIKQPDHPAGLLELSGLGWFEFANRVINDNPPSADENDLIRLFAKLGFGPGLDFRAASLPANTRSGMERAIPVAKEKITGYAKTMGESINGWRLIRLNRDIRGTTYIERAAIAFERLTESSAEEILCAEGYADGQGEALNGNQRYVLNLEAGKPPVKAFWSLAMYDLPERMMVRNPIDRYSIRSRDPGLKKNADGSLEIYLQHEDPGIVRRSNWLPAPDGDFFVVMRMYCPGEEIVNGSYNLPPVTVRN